MGKKLRTFTKEFKMQVIEELKSGIPVASLSRKYELAPKMIYKWKSEYQKKKEKSFPGKGNKSEEKRIEDLERLIGRQAIEIDFLKKLLRSLEEER